MQSLSIQSLKLSNYRCFETLTITLHPQLTVLVSENGAGKTSILDAIAVALGPYIGAFDEAVGRHFEPNDIRKVQVRSTASKELEESLNGVRLEARGIIPGNIDKINVFDKQSNGSPLSLWARALTSPKNAKTTIKDAKNLIDYGKRLQDAVRTPGNQVLLPLIAYYGTGRLWQQKKLTANKELLGSSSRTIGYTDCLDPASSYKNFATWFRYWSRNAKDLQLKDQEHSSEYKEFYGYIESVRTAVNICLHPAGWGNIEYSHKLEKIVAHHEQHGELPVELLSDGIRSMIGMIADIAFRATKLNGQLGEQAAELTPGIVLIDEVDMHLHPSWQQVVLQKITQAFPKIQFVVTTHSPQVLSTVPRENIRLIEQTDSDYCAIIPDFSPLGHESGDALAKIMGTHRQPPFPLQTTVRRFEQLVRTGNEHSEEAETLKNELNVAGYQFHESDYESWRFIATLEAAKGK